ncbi:MAG: DNA polymerase III subunit delta' [Hyphomicrobiaceae bacterium]|nr:DNA polymerase III subunit delta' [Hyphomicrobiaceae bacterium]
MTETDVIPEADRLEGFVHPRMIPQLAGHGSAEQRLLAAFHSDRLHHAWLFAGPEGVGKATLAYRFARFLLAQGEDASGSVESMALEPDHAVFSQVAALSHPDLLVLRRAWQPDRKRLATAVSVADVRRLTRFFGRTAGTAWRVVIIDRADEMNTAAANALLKNLEEPPPRCVFLMICSAPGRLPVTIRSRSQLLRFGPLDPNDLQTAVESAFNAAGLAAPDAEKVGAVLPLAQGSVRRALQLLVGGGDELYANLVRLLNALPGVDQRAVHDLADKLTAPGKEASYELFFSLAEESLARIATHAATGEGATQDEEAIAARLKGQPALAHWASLWETVRRTKAEADVLNLDRKNLVLGTFFKLEETAREALQ